MTLHAKQEPMVTISIGGKVVHEVATTHVSCKTNFPRFFVEVASERGCLQVALNSFDFPHVPHGVR